MAAASTPAINLVRRHGIAHVVHEYRAPEPHGRGRGQRPDYGLQAATALGVPPARVFKTLIATVDGRLAAAVLPVDRQLDPKALAAALGARRAELVDPALAERASGSVVGGISPLALRRSMPVVIDLAIEAQALVLVSAGRRGLQLELAPVDLIRLAEASLAAIARLD